MSAPRWNGDYADSLEERFDTLTDGLGERVEDITQARTVPSVTDMPLGSGRRTFASVLFFDICGFTDRTAADDLDALGKTLYMLDCVIPMVMHVVFDYGGYVEKNTGDGLMAIFGVGEKDQRGADAALDTAVTSFWVLDEIVNPKLRERGIAPVEASIGIDHGQLLLARIGTRRGAANQERSHLTAVGPTANIAFKLQDHAGPDELMVGQKVKEASVREKYFSPKTIADWSWVWRGGQDYEVFDYTGRRVDPWSL